MSQVSDCWPDDWPLKAIEKIEQAVERADKAEVKNKGLREAVVMALQHDLAPGGWGGPAAMRILEDALAAKETPNDT